MTGAGPRVCLPATGIVKGIKNALHHHTPHPFPPPHLQRLYHHGRPLSEDEPLYTMTTQHGFTHLTVRLKGEGLKGGGRRTRARDTDSDSTSASYNSHTRRKKGRKNRAKGELTRALRAMTSLADSVAGIRRTKNGGAVNSWHMYGATGSVCVGVWVYVRACNTMAKATCLVHVGGGGVNVLCRMPFRSWP